MWLCILHLYRHSCSIDGKKIVLTKHGWNVILPERASWMAKHSVLTHFTKTFVNDLLFLNSFDVNEVHWHIHSKRPRSKKRYVLLFDHTIIHTYSHCSHILRKISSFAESFANISFWDKIRRPFIGIFNKLESNSVYFFLVHCRKLPSLGYLWNL